MSHGEQTLGEIDDRSISINNRVPFALCSHINDLGLMNGAELPHDDHGDSVSGLV